VKRYPVIIEQTGTGYSAFSPDVPGCVAAGDTPENTRFVGRSPGDHIRYRRQNLPRGPQCQTVGCALVAMSPGEFEVAKMAVTESMRRSGIGRQLLEKAITEARALGAHRLYLETNKTLVGAIRLYESVGFRHLPSERVIPSAYARADVYMELHL